MRNRLKALLQTGLIYVFRWFCSARARRQPAVLIPGYTGLGNFVLKTPWIGQLRRSLPETQLDLLAGNRFGTEFVLEGRDWIRETILFPPTASLRKAIPFYWRLRGKYDAILIPIDVAHVPHLYYGAVIAGIPLRIGHVDPRVPLPSLARHALTHPIPLRLGQHEVDLGYDLVEVLKPGIPRTDEQVVAVAPRFSDLLQATFRERGIRPGEYVVIQPSAANGTPTPKLWPHEHWREWISQALRQGLRLVAVGDKGDAPAVNAILAPFGDSVVNLSGKTSIGELSKIIQESRGVLCHDSGVMHIANALGTPLIALYGPQDSVTTIPRGKRSTFVKVQQPCSPCVGMQGNLSEEEAVRVCPVQIRCMRELKPDDVMKRAKENFGL